MMLQALMSNELPSYLFYDTINHHHSAFGFSDNVDACEAMSSLGLAHAQLQDLPDGHAGINAQINTGMAAAGEGRKKRRRRPRSCKNKEEAESQRMTHIAVERNRRRLMNEHLAMLRSLMPESYIQKGDQASIVGGAIEFVKELEQLVQSLEAQKMTLLLQQQGKAIEHLGSGGSKEAAADSPPPPLPPPFAQFFAYPQYIWCHPPRDCPPPAPSRPAALADIEVTLIETHANLRILSPKRPRQLVKMVAGLQTLRLIILHLNVTTLDSVVLYSLSVKVEDGCNLTNVDDIAAAVHHILSLIESETALSSQ